MNVVDHYLIIYVPTYNFSFLVCPKCMWIRKKQSKCLNDNILPPNRINFHWNINPMWLNMYVYWLNILFLERAMSSSFHDWKLISRFTFRSIAFSYLAPDFRFKRNNYLHLSGRKNNNNNCNNKIKSEETRKRERASMAERKNKNKINQLREVTIGNRLLCTRARV